MLINNRFPVMDAKIMLFIAGLAGFWELVGCECERHVR